MYRDDGRHKWEWPLCTACSSLRVTGTLKQVRELPIIRILAISLKSRLSKPRRLHTIVVLPLPNPFGNEVGIPKPFYVAFVLLDNEQDPCRIQQYWHVSTPQIRKDISEWRLRKSYQLAPLSLTHHTEKSHGEIINSKLFAGDRNHGEIHTSNNPVRESPFTISLTVMLETRSG